VSPKISRPDRASDDEPEEPEESGLPPGHMQMLPRTRQQRPAPRKPLPLWLKAGGFVLLLVATVGVVWLLGRPDDPRESARGTTELVAKALSDGDTSAFQSYTCRSDEVQVDDWTQLGTATVLDVSGESEGTASATLMLSRPPDTDMVLLLHEEDDSWCVVAPGLCPLADDPLLTPGDLNPCAGRPGR